METKKEETVKTSFRQPGLQRDKVIKQGIKENRNPSNMTVELIERGLKYTKEAEKDGK